MIMIAEAMGSQPNDEDDAPVANEVVEDREVEPYAGLSANIAESINAPSRLSIFSKKLNKTLVFSINNWGFVAFCLTLISFSLTFALSNVSPLFFMKEIAVKDKELTAKQREYDYRVGTARSYVSLGQAFLNQGKFEEAGVAFAKSLEFDEHDIDALSGVHKVEVFAASSQGEYDPTAVEQRIRTLLIDKGSEGPRPKATCTEFLESVEKSNSDVDTIDPNALAALGDLKLSIGDFGEARACHEAARLADEKIHDVPSLAHSYAVLGEITLREAKDSESVFEALGHFATAATMFPYNIDYMANHASALLAKGDGDKAIDLYERLFKIDPEKILPYVEYLSALRRSITNREKNKIKILNTSHYLAEILEIAELWTIPKNNNDWLIQFQDRTFQIKKTEDKVGYTICSIIINALLIDDRQLLEKIESIRGDIKYNFARASAEPLRYEIDNVAFIEGPVRGENMALLRRCSHE